MKSDVNNHMKKALSQMQIVSYYVFQTWATDKKLDEEYVLSKIKLVRRHLNKMEDSLCKN